ncbi:hypothetical protein [Methylomonas rhizoryzae]|uniref:hypothetical protein n=1 Tax=Methylomonas rhizoryzae TaxID=2608981 RepID=UPI001231E5F4|nr:hypothetical protein [Methylomonas rhizoryzae]
MFGIEQLEILSSPGLVRRATKSLEKTKVEWTAKESDAWQFDFESQQGKILPARIEQSVCNCPATGLCKHIVAAAIDYLNHHQAQSFTPPALDHPQLFDSAGKAACRQAYRLWQSGAWPQAEIRIAERHVEVSWLQQKAVIRQGEGLDAVLCESGAASERLIAALLYQPPSAWPDWLEREQQAAQSEYRQQREQLCGQVKTQTCILLQTGVRNLQPANLSELTSLVPQLKNGGEPRLGNAVLALQEWVERRSQAQGLDPNAAILRQLALIYAWADSTLPAAEQEERHATELYLLCLGGHQWRTVSGALGLNMLFLSDDGRIFSASLARSGKGRGFSIAEAWKNCSLWSGAPLNRDLPGRYLRLHAATYNPRNGLSLSQKTEAKPSDEAFEWVYTQDWMQLTELPEYGYALLKVERCLACEFDETRQQLLLQLVNDRSQRLLVRQTYSEGMSERLVNLQSLKNARDFHLVIRHVIADHSHQFEALCVYRDQWQSLDFQKPEKHRLDLLTRLLGRFKNRPLEQTAEPPLAELCRSALETLQDYPHCSATRLDASQAQFAALGLDLLQQKLTIGRQQPEAVLQLVYLLTLAYHSANGWPVAEAS